MRRLDGITNSMKMGLSKVWSEGQGRLACCMQSMGPQKVGHDLVTTKLTWTSDESRLFLFVVVFLPKFT